MARPFYNPDMLSESDGPCPKCGSEMVTVRYKSPDGIGADNLYAPVRFCKGCPYREDPNLCEEELPVPVASHKPTIEEKKSWLFGVLRLRLGRPSP